MTTSVAPTSQLGRRAPPCLARGLPGLGLPLELRRAPIASSVSGICGDGVDEAGDLDSPLRSRA